MADWRPGAHESARSNWRDSDRRAHVRLGRAHSIGAAGGFAWVVSSDTHNDLHLAVDALSGGRSDTIYA